MTHKRHFRRARGLTAAVVGTLFLFTTVATPLVEANFWEQRRDATRRMNGKAQGAPTLLAQLPGSMGSMDGVLPPVNGALGSGLQSVPSADLSGVPTASDLRASALPSWLRGLPNSAGEIRDVALAKNAETAPVVVLVQDVHNVFSAQKNIAGIVSHIESAAARDNRGPVLIGLEGGVGAFDIKRFRAFRESKGHRLASELLLKTNFISGPEYYAFLSEREPLLWGIETPADYIENVEAVRASQPATERVNVALSAAQRAVEERGEAVFSKELKDLNRTLAAHSNGTATIVDLVRVLRERVPKTSAPEVDKLQKALATESTLDFSRVERERSALIESLVRTLDKPSIERLVSASLNYRAGRISFGTYHAQLKTLVKGHGIRWSDYAAFDRYVQYVLLAESIDKFRLFDEIEDLKTRAVASASRTREEKAVMDLAEDLRLAGRLVRHEFGPAEWSNYATRKEPLAHLQPRLAEVLGANVVPGPSNEDLALFERFYVAADRRNDSLAANLLVKAKETDAKIMMLVAGGFHTPALSSRLKAKGFSVVTITPAMGEIPKGPNYLDIFLVKNIPIEQFLQGEKLYLSPLKVLGEKMDVNDYPLTGQTLERTASAAEVAASIMTGGDSPKQGFPDMNLEVEGDPTSRVLVTASNASGTSRVMAEKGLGSREMAGNAETRGISVESDEMRLSFVTGGTDWSPVMSKQRGILNIPMFAEFAVQSWEAMVGFFFPGYIRTIRVPGEDLGSDIVISPSSWAAPVQPGGFTEYNVGRLAQASVEVIQEEMGLKGLSGTSIMVGYDSRPKARAYAIHMARVFQANGATVLFSDQVTPAPSGIDVNGVAQGAPFVFWVTAGDRPKFANLITEVPFLGIKMFKGGLPVSESWAQKIAIRANTRPQNAHYQYSRRALALTDVVKENVARLSRIFEFRNENWMPDSLKRRIVIDSMHGAAAGYGSLLKEVGIVREHQNSEFLSETDPSPLRRNGDIIQWAPDPSNPMFLQSTLKTLRNGDWGFFYDGGGERLVVAEKSLDGHLTLLSGNDLAILFASYLIENGWKGPIVRTLPTTRWLDRLAEAHGLEVKVIPTGSDEFSASKLTPTSLAADASGHLIFPWKGEVFSNSVMGQTLLALQIIKEKGSLTDYLRLAKEDSLSTRTWVPHAEATPSEKARVQKEFDLIKGQFDFSVPQDRVEMLSKIPENLEKSRAFSHALTEALVARGVHKHVSKIHREDHNGLLVEFSDGTWCMWRRTTQANNFRIYVEQESEESVGHVVSAVHWVLDGMRELTALQSAIRVMGNDYLASQGTNSYDEWVESATDVYAHVRAFLELAEAYEHEVNGYPAHDLSREVAPLEILRGVSTAMELPQMSYAIPSEWADSIKVLQNRLTSLAIRVGTSLEKPRVDAIEAMFANDPALAAEERRVGVRALMSQSHFLHRDGGAQLEKLLPDDFEPYVYHGQIWAPYMTPELIRSLVIKLGLTLDDNENIRVPESVDSRIVDFIVKQTIPKEGEDSRSADERLQYYVKYEGGAFKSPESTLVVARAIKHPVADYLDKGTLTEKEREEAMKQYLAFCAAFRQAVSFLKIRELWVDKRDHLEDAALKAIEDVKALFSAEEIAAYGLDDRTLAMRVVALHQAWQVISLAAQGKMPQAKDFKPRASEAALAKAVESVALAGGMASRWNDSLHGLVRAGLLKTLLEGPRQVAVHWLPEFSGIGLLLDSLATKGGGRLSTVVSPFTWIDIMKEIYRGRDAAGPGGARVQVHTILQNPGEALRMDKAGHFLFDEEGRIGRVDGKVLGHGNVRGAPLAMLNSLAAGTPYGLWRAGDGPLAQIGLPQIQEIRDRMVWSAEKGKPLAHVSIGNWRSVGQLGGGLVTVKGTPHQYDTLIPNTPNKDGFVPNKDITVFSTFENMINYAAAIYAVSEGILVGNRPLMTWQDYVGVSALEPSALRGLSERINQLTPEQVLQITDRFINLLPSEYVEKKDGDSVFLQPEQVSGMWHGVLTEAVKSRMEEERSTQGNKIPKPEIMNMVVVDISVNEVEILSRGSTKEYDGPIPSFAEVKSAPGLYAILEFVQSLIARAAIRRLFSRQVLVSAQGILSGEKVENRGQPRDSYRRFYNNIRNSTRNIREIRSADLGNARRFLDEEGRLLPADVRRANGIFGLTEVGFVPSGSVRRKMAAFQQELKKEFGDKIYLVKPGNLHLTFQGLEQRWQDQSKGTARPDLGHEGIDHIDRSDKEFQGAFSQAGEIPSEEARVQVSGVNWNPEIGIFWEIQPILRDGEPDPIMARREGWDRPRPRPPHITAANFSKPFTTEELNRLREIVDRYQAGFGEITFSQAQIVAYEDTTLDRYVVMHTTPLKPRSTAGGTGRKGMGQGGAFAPWDGESAFLAPIRALAEYFREFRRTLLLRFESPVDISKPIIVSTRRLKFSGQPTEVLLSLGKLGEGLTLTRRYRFGSLILTNTANGEEIEITPVAQERPGKVGDDIRPVVSLGLKIGDYVYTRNKEGIFNLENGWVGNIRLLKFFGIEAKTAADTIEESPGPWKDDRYLFGTVFYDPPSATVGDKWVSEIPSIDDIKTAMYFISELEKGDGYARLRIQNRLRYLHYLSVLARVRVGKGVSADLVLSSRLLATAGLRKAATVEGITGNLAGLVERILWSSGILVVEGEKKKAPLMEIDEKAKEKFKQEIPFTIEKPEDYDRLVGLARGFVGNGDWPVTFVCTIKNFAPDNYLAYLSALETISSAYGGNMTFLLSVERPGTLAHDLPGATTGLRRVIDIFGTDFFKERNIALVTDAGSKTRGGGVTNAQHGNFSLAPLLRVTSDGHLEVIPFLQLNLETILTAWLQMESHGRPIFIWAASDGMIRFGVRPGFGSKGFAEFPRRFIAASGPELILFQPDIARKMQEFATTNKVELTALFGNSGPPVVQSDFNSIFSGALDGAHALFNEKTLEEKGNFVTYPDGRINMFVEKQGFPILAATAVSKTDGRIVMNIFFLMADKQTIIELFVKWFHTLRDYVTGIRIGMQNVSVFATVLGGVTGGGDENDPRSMKTDEYVKKEGVGVLGATYGGNGADGQDIGNLDVNAAAFRTVINDLRLSFDERYRKNQNSIPINVTVYYDGTPLSALPESVRKSALFILRNVKVTAPKTGHYTLRLGKGSAILNSHIEFHEDFTFLSLSPGSIIIDSSIAGPMRFRGEKAVVQSVSHFRFHRSEGAPRTRDLAPSDGGFENRWIPVETLDIYADETIVTVFFAGEPDSVVVRSFGDFKLPVRIVAEREFPRMDQSAALQAMQKEHPKIFGVKGMSDALATTLNGKPYELSQYGMKAYNGYTFEEAKGRLDPVRTREHHNRVRRSVVDVIVSNMVTPATAPSRQLETNGRRVAFLDRRQSGFRQGGFLNPDAFAGIVQNKLARQMIAGILLLVISPVALAAPAVVLGSGTIDAVLAFLAAFGLVGRLYVKSNRARSGLLVLAVVSVMFLFSMPTFAAGPGVALAFGVMGAMKGVSQEQTLFEKTGRQPLGEELIPGVGKQFADLRMTTLELDRMMRGGPGEGINNLKTIGEMSRRKFPLYGIGDVNLPEYGEGREDERLSGAIDLLKRSRGNLLQEPGVLSGAAMDLTNALGFSAPRTAGPVFADHSVRAALLSGLAAGKDKGSRDFERVATAVIETLGAFSERLFGAAQGLKMKETLARFSALAKGKNGDVVVVDQIQPGVVKAVYLDETADPKMIENVMELVGRHLAPVGAEVLKKNGTTGNDITGVVVTLAPGLADGPQGKLIKRLLQMQNQVGERPVRIHQAEKSDDFVQETSEGYSVQLAKLLGLLNINSNLPGLRIQCIAPPTSTVVFDGSGLSNDVLVERIRWLLEGIGLRVSTDDAEREIRSLMATLKAA